MTRSKPPFRADVVGSLLRTAPLKEARAKREKGEITAAQLNEVEDREIEKIVKKQEEVGLKLATDGEFRRSWWHFDFYGMLDGVEIYELDHGIQFHGRADQAAEHRASTASSASPHHPMLEHFKFLKAHTRVDAENEHPEPGHAAFPPGAERGRPPRSTPTATPSSTIWRRPTGRRSARFYDAGCRYLQFDDTAWAYLCSPAELKKARDRGLDADRLAAGLRPRSSTRRSKASPPTWRSPRMSCRGNFRSTLISEGGYEPVAEILLGKLNYDGYFLEYDSDARRRLRAAALLAQGQQDRRARPRHHQDPARWRRRTTSSGASTRRPNTSRSISSACRRNAASPRPRRATCSPRTSNGRSCG